MKQTMNLTFSSSIADLVSVNSSFDRAKLRIAYTGKNRNKSHISKEVFEKCAHTMSNCPVVCNYNREDDSIGSHDMEAVRDTDGNVKIVNLTDPVGVVPESADYWWEIDEDDGVKHEYLCTEVLLWKRQEAYQKIKEDGITAQSMEININDGEVKDGLLYIYDFEFTAFCLLESAEPCYEGASLRFNFGDFKEQFSKMASELKDYLVASSSSEDGNNNKFSQEGGNNKVNREELIEKYGIDVSTLDFSMDDLTDEELEAKFAEIADAKANAEFELAQNRLSEIYRVLGEEKIESEWGTYSRYWAVDCDLDEAKVYAYDGQDGLLYSFGYSLDGDAVTIHYETRQRCKYSIVDFEGGEDQPMAVFAEMQKIADAKFAEMTAAAEDAEKKFSETIAEKDAEIETLAKFKADTEKAAADAEKKAEIEAVFADFEDLANVEDFQTLKAECEEDCMKYEIADLRKECFAIRGMNIGTAKFSMKNEPSVKIPVTKEEPEEVVYGGLFDKYKTNK